MRSEENGVGNQLNPQFAILDPALVQRMRWRCRRGLLELDIVLERFVEMHYLQLGEAERLAFEALLDLPDQTLWGMVAGRQQAQAGECQALLEKIRGV